MVELVDTISSLPGNSSFHRGLSIKCLWALANMKPTEISKTKWPGASSKLISDILSKKKLKEDEAVQKESLRLVEKLLSVAPAVACQGEYLSVWLPCVLQQAIGSVQVVRNQQCKRM